MVHTWFKDYIKYNGYDVEPVHIFLSGSGRTGLSHLVRVIYTLFYKRYFYKQHHWLKMK